MKKIAFITFVGIFLLLACGKKKIIREIDEDIVDGTWRVSLFEEDGVNETSDYTGYVFTFKSDGTVKAASGAGVVNGIWSTNKDDGHVDFNLTLPAPLDDLSDDWEVVNNSSNTLELKDISGGDGSVDYLTFKKI